MNGIVATIDFGSTGVRCIVGSIEDKNIKILAKAETKVSYINKDLTIDEESISRALIKILNMIEERLGHRISSTYINTPGQYINLVHDEAQINIHSDEKLIEEEDIINLHEYYREKYEDEEWKLVDVISHTFAIDGYDGIPDPIGMISKHLSEKAYIVLVKREYLVSIVNSLKTTGIKIDGIIISPLAVLEIISHQNLKKEMTAIIDCGGKMTEIYVAKNKKIIYYTLLNVGGENITRDISYGQEMPELEAERIKKASKFTMTIPVNNQIESFTDIITARSIEILELSGNILKEQDFFNEIDEVVLTGQGISMYKDIAEVAEFILNKTIRIDIGKEIGIINPDYLNAIGMLKYIMNELYVGNDDDKNSIDKENKDIKEESFAKRVFSSFVKIFKK